MGQFNWKTQEEIQEEQSKKTPTEELAQAQADLIYTLVMNGVI